MHPQPIASKKAVTPPVILFLEKPYRMIGFVLEVFIARGWIKKTGFDAEHYQLTSKGAKFLKN